jgi:hypothetical protein
MKPILLLLSILVTTSVFCQCDKTVIIKSEKGRDLLNGTPRTELPVNATITITKNKISLTATVNGDTETLDGEITGMANCDWLQVFKTGREKIKAVIKKGREGAQNSIVEIVTENGHTRITFSSDPDKGSALQFDVLEYTIAD